MKITPRKPSYFPPRVRAIFSEEAARMDLIPSMLRVPGGHSRRVSLARRRAAVRLRSMGFSLTQIGLWMNAHHTSVLYMLKKAVIDDRI